MATLFPALIRGSVLNVSLHQDSQELYYFVLTSEDEPFGFSKTAEPLQKKVHRKVAKARRRCINKGGEPSGTEPPLIL